MLDLFLLTGTVGEYQSLHANACTVSSLRKTAERVSRSIVVVVEHILTKRCDGGRTLQIQHAGSQLLQQPNQGDAITMICGWTVRSVEHHLGGIISEEALWLGGSLVRPLVPLQVRLRVRHQVLRPAPHLVSTSPSIIPRTSSSTSPSTSTSTLPNTRRVRAQALALLRV
jgi:hypothetical protein